MSVTYRSALDKDAPFILDSLKSVSGDIEDIQPGQFLIAEDKNKIVGCVRIKNINSCLKLASLAVAPNYRRMGIGSKLISKILEKETKRPIYLFCNIKNKDFYEKFGFRKIEVKNIPKVLKEDYDNLLNLKFAKNIKLLIVMVLV